MTPTQQLLDALTAFAPDRLPAEVLAQAGTALYDCLGAQLAATSGQYPIMPLLARLVRETGGTPESRLVGSSLRTNAATAALANGTLAYYCDIESHHPAANVHAIAVIGPAALAVGERQHATGAEVLAAIVAGVDIAARVSYALGPGAQYARGFHPTTVAGTLGSAVTAGLLLRLDNDRFRNALGLAGTSAGGLLSWVDDPTEQSRPLNIGLAAQAGVQAALLAATGFRGPADILGGKYPFGQAFTGQWDQHALLDGLGTRHEITRLFYKRNACCVFIPAGLDALLDIMATESLSPQDIDKITIRAPESSYRVIDNNPLRSHNVQYVLAVAAHQGHVAFADILTDRRADPDIAALSHKITITGDPGFDRHAHQSIGSTVHLTTNTGVTHHREVEHPLGSHENPLSTQDLDDKFAALTAGILTPAQAVELKSTIDTLHTLPDINNLTRLLELG
ncbi:MULTISPECIES: MmgE/PrpD family protein [unclassified Crossiella]|uniref:MmgE/PrpD family protein n=1 Tax=unclassified Crossiella TaxID=2620835 RepID=UPI00200006B1|nr:MULTISPECIES: MmgE/PrpD family protein [unclassified Crossiella]MCK2243754.1 MmgE/PrpD family protein [Crossiella sp. S99.2]MCK2257613.1 MmgE/PrpD family protein [Crossiella sp. S99.1]